MSYDEIGNKTLFMIHELIKAGPYKDGEISLLVSDAKIIRDQVIQAAYEPSK